MEDVKQEPEHHRGDSDESLSFDKLNENRNKLMDALISNKALDGFLELLSELYPDNAHFIYELLQNAEDTGAKTVSFNLRANQLDFEHDGKDFSLSDVDAITNVSTSKKRNDETKIGKFGIGFKAVFSYTDNPEIYSGDYFFKIKDLFVPEIIPIDKKAEKTHFVFPFNNKSKSPATAVIEIEEELRSLDEGALLFLSNISRIEYLCPGHNEHGYLERTEIEGGIVQITIAAPGGERRIANYLLYSKNVLVEEEGKKENCRVAIAYQLANSEISGEKWKIVPVEAGQVCIFFPASGEASKANLKFHLHAPFASVVARDLVRNTPANEKLLETIAELTVESLNDIKNRKMLTTEFLAIMPIEDDNLTPFYEPIRAAVVKSFRELELVPTKSGVFGAANNLFRADATEISEVFDDKDMSFFTGLPEPLWAKNVTQKNPRENKFILSLGMKSWGWSQIYKVFHPETKKDKKAIEEWVQGHDSEWLKRLYTLLSGLRSKYEREPYVWYDGTKGMCRIDYKVVGIVEKNLEILKCNRGGDTVFMTAANAYFEPGESERCPPGICFIDAAVYDAESTDGQKESARSFLEEVGVRPYDEKAALSLMLKNYEENRANISLKSHLEDLQRFVLFWKKSKDLNSEFAACPFVREQSGDVSYCEPNKLYIDEPYQQTGITEIAHIINKYAIWEGYEDVFEEESLLEDLLKMLRDLGAFYRIQVDETDTSKNPQGRYLRNAPGQIRWDTRIDRDYTIENIEDYLKLESFPARFAASRLIWEAITNEKKDITKATYRNNRSSGENVVESLLVYYLKNEDWIPDEMGVFHKPSAMTVEQLLTDFPYDNNNGMLTAIGFGADARALKEAVEKQDIVRKATDALGFDQRVADLLKDLSEAKTSGEKLESVLLGLLEEGRKPAFPSRRSPNPERRAEKIYEEMESSPAKTYEKRERSVRISTPDDEKTIYLRDMYTNDNGEMVCQICHNIMPFRKRDGEYCFEGVELFDKTIVREEHEILYLALCPNCAEEYKEYIKRGEQYASIKTSIKELDLGGKEEFHIDAQLEKEKKIKFNEIHIRDIQAALNALESKED